MALDLPPQLILPDHYVGNRPAIIRPGNDIRLPSVDDLLKHGADNAMMPAFGMPRRSGAVPKTVSFVTSVTADANTITMPTVVTGDFVLYTEFPAQAASGTDQMDVVTPTGGGAFTQLVSYPTDSDMAGVTRNDLAVWSWGRIVTDGAGETGDVITGYSADTNTGRRRKTILVFRGSPILTGFNAAESVSKVWSTGDPAATSSDLSAGTAPFLALGFYRGAAAIGTLSASPTPTGNVDNGTTTRIAYLICNAADASTWTIDQDDSGSATISVSYLVELT